MSIFISSYSNSREGLYDTAEIAIAILKSLYRKKCSLHGYITKFVTSTIMAFYKASYHQFSPRFSLNYIFIAASYLR